MSPLEKKKIQVELIQVEAAKATLELRIEVLKDEIQRLLEHISISENKSKELQEKLKG